MPARRVAVFIEYQNCYGIARREFCDSADPGIRGHLLPRALAHFLAGKAGGAYELVYCGVYCGIASSEREPRTFAARRKQAAAWEKAGATVVMRPLRYQGADERPREKGIDVRLAIDVVAKALAMTPFLAMMWRSADGGLTIAFWWAAALSTLGIVLGAWSLVAPESMRFHYFRALNSRRSESGRHLLTPADGWGWSSIWQIRAVGVLVIAVATAFMTWILFFTVPGVAY